MARAKRGSRIITVQGHRFRWRVRETFPHPAPVFEATLWLSAELADSPASQLRVAFKGQLAYGFLHRNGEWDELLIHPNTVANCIRAGLEQGWDPLAKRPNLTIEDGYPFLLPASEPHTKGYLAAFAEMVLGIHAGSPQAVPGDAQVGQESSVGETSI